MSSILKALRKLEHEKSEMGEGSVDLARDILKRSYEERHSSSAGTIAVVITALLLLAVGWWLLAPEATTQQNTQLEQPIEAILPILPVASNTLPQQLHPVIYLPNRPLVQRSEELAELQQKKPQPAITDKSPFSNGAATASLIIPDLIIDEIVFVVDPNARLAVINDLPVMQGTDIDGARVIEILSDRVRFEFKGVRFDKYKTPGN